jgi:hypothetical protein
VTEKFCESYIKVRAPDRLVRELDAEARRRLVSKSALVRQVLARELGLVGQVTVSTDERRDLRSG